MRETERIADQLRRAFEGDAWHGPAILELLTSIDAAKATRQPLEAGHNIWEIVLHIRAWNEAVLRRIRGEAVALTPAEDWPNIGEVSEDRWVEAVMSLKLAHNKCYNAIAGMPDQRLWDTVPGKQYDFYFMLHGLVQHDLYHAGQISLLKKS